MAMRNLEIVITVTDKATKPLNDVGRTVKNTGKAANEANTDFTKFNRTLFSTAAFVGTFVKMFSSLTNSLDQGSELDRLSNQFERVLGPKGTFFQNISQLTDASIDRMEAMRQGISLRSLGIVRSTEQLADVVSKAGVASKMAGKDSAEGIKNYSEFLKDGNVSHLQFLNLIAQTNPGLQAQMAILGKVGGVMGNVISTQARLAIGQRLLNAATQGNLKGFRDLRDIMLDAKQNFTLFRQETGRLLLTALAPLIDKVSLFMLKMSQTIDHIRKNDKNLIFLTKTIILLTGGVLGLAGAIGTLRLAAIALSSVGFGLPKIILLMTTLGGLFLGVTSKVDKFTDKLKLFAAFVKGVYQLVTSLNTKTGIAKIDEDIKALLEKNGLMTFAQNVARVGSVVKRVVEDMVDAFTWSAKKIDSIFGGIGRKFIDMISKFKQPWENFWVSDSATPIEKFMRNFTVIGGTLGSVITGIVIKNVLGRVGGALSRIPIIGGLFGGGRNGGPKGSKSDPLYTRDADKAGGGFFGFMSKFTPGALTGGVIAFLKETILNAATAFQVIKTLGIGEALTALGRFALAAVEKFFVVGTAISAVMGAVQGIWEKMGEWSTFFTGLADMGKAVFDITAKFIQNNAVLKYIFDTLGSIATGIFNTGKFLLVDGPTKLFGMIKEGWRLIFGLLGDLAGMLGMKLSEKAREWSPDSFKPPATGIAPPPDFSKTGIAVPTTAGQSGEKTSTTIPEDSGTSVDTIDMLGEQLKTVSGSQRKQMQQSVEAALRTDSESGNQITPDEMGRIMGRSLNSALDNASVLQNIESNTRKTVQPNQSRRSP